MHRGQGPGAAGRGLVWGGAKPGGGATRGVPVRSTGELIPVAPVALARDFLGPLEGGEPLVWRGRAGEQGRAAFGVGQAGGGTVGGDVLRHRVVCLPGDLANPKAGTSRHLGS